MIRGEMLDDDKGHAAIFGYVAKEQIQGFEAASRGAYTDYGEHKGFRGGLIANFLVMQVTSKGATLYLLNIPQIKSVARNKNDSNRLKQLIVYYSQTHRRKTFDFRHLRLIFNNHRLCNQKSMRETLSLCYAVRKCCFGGFPHARRLYASFIRIGPSDH